MTGGVDTGTTSTETQRVSRPFSVAWLVAAFFAGAIGWSAFHLVGYLWATVACSVPERTLIGGTALGASTLTVGAMVYEYRAWRGMRSLGESGTGQRAAISDDRFVALCGLALNAFFLASILLTALSVFFLGACE